MKNWKDFIEQQNKQPHMKVLWKKLFEMKKGGYFPKQENVYRAFKLTPLDKVKAVVIGQDPYYNGTADGLAFSTTAKKTPGSLEILYRYLLKHEFIDEKPTSNELTPWAEQGILLLNSGLTVENGKAGSMLKDWKPFVAAALRLAVESNNKIQVYTFGTHAQDLARAVLKDQPQRLHCYVHPAWFLRKKYDVPDDINANPFYAMDLHIKKHFNTQIEWKI